MVKFDFPLENQGVELSKLVTLERIRRRRLSLPKILIDQAGLTTDSERNIASALSGETEASALSELEQRYLKQIQAL